jgi:pimeloyl-ACP methyl ester carboxylesterase
MAPHVIEVNLSFLDPGDGPRLAYRKREGTGPTTLFLPGYASDMEGSKAVALDAFAARRGLAMLRFDYSGTGSSEGRFEDGSLERWIDEALLMLDRQTVGPVVLVGSSMGGWIALHLAMRRPDRVKALVGIAAAPDFTDWGFPDHLRERLAAGETLRRELPDGGAQITTATFWQSGQTMRLLGSDIAVDCPVRLIHGDRDEDVPVDIAFRLKDRLRSADVQVTVVKGGGHRLSAPHEIETIERTVAALVEQSS